MRPASPYRYCPYCKTEVPVERKAPKVLLLLLCLMAVSILITVLFFPRFVFLFLVLPFGFGLWRRSEHCAICGRRLPPVGSSLA